MSEPNPKAAPGLAPVSVCLHPDSTAYGRSPATEQPSLILRTRICSGLLALMMNLQVPIQPPVVLLVEDHADTRAMLQCSLEHRLKCQVLAVQDGSTAVEVAVATTPLLVLMDLDLPLDQGLVAAPYLHQQPETRGIPVIGISARCDESEIHDQARAAGCWLCVDKMEVVEVLTTHPLIKLVIGRSWPPTGAAAPAS